MLFISFIFSVISRINAFFITLTKQFFESKKSQYYSRKPDPALADKIIKTYYRRKTPEHAIKYINGSRANLLLKEVKTKSSIMILKQFITIIELYGKPKKLRMDNEPNFKSRIFRFGLFLLGIKPEYTKVACPWMNWRIERFFGTLKQHIRKIILTQESLDQRLIEFRYFYNHIRTHSNLNGRTPAEVWDKKSCNKRGEAYHFELWQGVLSGFYLPPD